MDEREIPDELIDQLLGEYEGPEQLTGPDGLISQLRKRLIERAAGAELSRHLGYPAGAEVPESVRDVPGYWDDACRHLVKRDRVIPVCKALLDELPVSDIDIQEVPIEDIIRQIFAR